MARRPRGHCARRLRRPPSGRPSLRRGQLGRDRSRSRPLGLRGRLVDVDELRMGNRPTLAPTRLSRWRRPGNAREHALLRREPTLDGGRRARVPHGLRRGGPVARPPDLTTARTRPRLDDGRDTDRTSTSRRTRSFVRFDYIRAPPNTLHTPLDKPAPTSLGDPQRRLGLADALKHESNTTASTTPACSTTTTTSPAVPRRPSQQSGGSSASRPKAGSHRPKARAPQPASRPSAE